MRTMARTDGQTLRRANFSNNRIAAVATPLDLIETEAQVWMDLIVPTEPGAASVEEEEEETTM